MDFPVWLVVSGLTVVGLLAGFLMHRSDFCMTAAFRDLFLFKSLRMARPLVLLVSFSALLFELCRLAGALPSYPFPWFGPPAGVNFFGGVVFGLGMVMAGGCVVGVLYKAGAGNQLALVALLGLLAGSALYAEIHEWWVPLASRTAFATSAVTLPQWFGLAASGPVIVLVMAGGFCCWRWRQAGHWADRNAAEGFIPLWMTACGLAVLNVGTVLLCGLPMGVTTSYAKAVAWLESWLIPGHMASLLYFTAAPVQHALPIDGVMRSGGAGPFFDIVAVVQVPLLLGILGGGWLSARLLDELQLVRGVPFNQVSLAFAGGIVMALGSRMAPGCNVWHLWGGLPLLTMQSLLFTVGLLPGAWLGGRILQRVLVPAAGEKVGLS